MLGIQENRGDIITLDKIRTYINENKGRKVKVIYNEGRNKVYEYSGKIVEVYNNVFIISINDIKKSISYRDILINDVKVSF